tara:strand:+ start:9372 stop:10589 length:1218 start_codon:yes stop_codon:yes gene_type:complete
MNFDLDINTYNLTELENLLNLTTPYTIEILNDKKQNLKNKITQMDTIQDDKRKKILVFLDNISEKLLNNLTQNFFVNKSTTNQFPDINTLTNTNKLIDANDNLKYVNTTNNSKTIKKSINIDSLFRTDYYTTKSSNFTVSLPERINKVISMRISCIQIPLTSYAITPELENNSFNVQLYIGSNPSGEVHTINLPAGNYEPKFLNSSRAADIEAAVNYQLQNVHSDISNSIGFTVDKISGKSVFGLLSTVSSGIDGFKIDFNTDPSNNTPINFKLGWLLGFRAANYIGQSVTSEGICNISRPKYMFLAINDYQNSSYNYFSATYNESIIAPNIMCRINIGTIMEDNGMYTTGEEDDFGSLVNRTRDYFGPTDINKLTFTLYDEYGRIIDLNYMDWSLVLTFECLYD